MTKIYYYISQNGNNPFSDFLDSLEHKQQAKILRLIFQIEEYGLISILPHTKKLSNTPFWEIRILGKDNLRIIYLIPTENEIVILHAFNKKSKKTPTKEIQIAINRYSDWKSHN
ncbi:MAG: type II toxin-antitoxin system RelE/ParE family toxin [Candidatus Shapirobacteria bacterium]